MNKDDLYKWCVENGIRVAVSDTHYNFRKDDKEVALHQSWIHTSMREYGLNLIQMILRSKFIINNGT